MFPCCKLQELKSKGGTGPLPETSRDLQLRLLAADGQAEGVHYIIT